MGEGYIIILPKSRKLLDRASKFCNIDFKTLLFVKNDNLGDSKFTQPAVVLNSFMCYLAIEESLNSARTSSWSLSWRV